MAGLSKHKQGWTVSWHEGGKRNFRSFREESDARTFMADKGLVHSKRGPGEGQRRRTPDQVLEHLAANFELVEHGCWVWTSRLTKEGYASMTWQPTEGAPVIAGGHRLAWSVAVGPVPDGLVIDHLCRNRACVNPDHLVEPVIQRENVMRSPIAPGAINAAKTHCPQGHPYSPENTYTYTFKTRKTTTRICRTCQRAHQRRYSAARKQVSA